MSQPSLRNKTLKGVGWSATENVLRQGVSFCIGLILARLLSPAEYGMIGLAMIVITILSTFVDSGFANALIRKNDATEEDYSTMFIVNMVMSILVYVFLFILAPFVSQFLNAEITQVIRALGIGVLIKAFSIVQDTNLTKHINFKVKTKTTFYSVLAGGVVGVTGAFLGWGVWALVAQQLLTSFINTLFLWILNPWHPTLKFSVDSLRYMWGFGWKVLLGKLLNQIWTQIYTIVVGKVYDTATLGQYSRAKHYASLFSVNLTETVRKVSYPTLANIQNEQERMVAAMRRMIKVTMFVTAVCMFSLGAVSVPLIYCMIGEKWLEAASYLPFMCVSMSLYPLHSINLNMLMVQGRSGTSLYLEVIKKVLSLLPISLGIYIGIKWMLVGAIFTGTIAFFLNSYYTGQRLNYSSWMQLKDVAPSYIIATIIALSVYFFRYLPISYFIILPIQLVVGVSVFFAICETIKPSEYLEVKSIAKDVIHKYIRK